jgi:hypothetical protein
LGKPVEFSRAFALPKTGYRLPRSLAESLRARMRKPSASKTGAIRVNNYIFGQLERVDRSDQDQNEVVADKIADVINLVGEPAACTALFEAKLLKNEPTVLERLLP